MKDQLNSLIAKMKSSTNSIESYTDGKKLIRSFSDVYKDVCKLHDILSNLGVQPRDHVGIIGSNSYEWVVADFTCIAMGLISVPLDPTVNHDMKENFEEFSLKILISEYPEDYPNVNVLDIRAFHDSELDCSTYQFTPYKYNPDDELTFKFTSGSTQRPKSILAKKKSVDAALTYVQDIFHHNKDDKIMVFLPMQTYQQRYWPYSAIIFDHDVIVIPKSYVFNSIKVDRPTVIMGVPYFYEHLHKIYLEEESNQPDLSSTQKRALFHNLLGGNIRYLWTGSAPIGMETLKFYQDMDIPLFQGYGMNEVCIVSKNNFEHNKVGSAGKLLPGKIIKFDEDNQILIKSEYEVNTTYNNALPEDNEKTFLKDGYVATGDLGYIDDEGYLFINGRSKELIIFSNAQKCHPIPIEKTVENTTKIKHCVVYGNDKSYLVALIIPTSPEVTENEVNDILQSVNEKLLPKERIYKFHIERSSFSQENGLLTSSNKIKRAKIYDVFKDKFEALYS